MTPADRDANGLTPTEVRVAVLVANAGIVTPEVRQRIADRMNYRTLTPVDGFIRAIRQKLDCPSYELPTVLRSLGYADHEETT